MCGLTVLLSFRVIAGWSLGWSLLCAMSAGGLAVVVAAWRESVRGRMPEQSSGQACERPPTDSAWEQATGLAAWGVRAVVVLGTVLSMTVIAVALSAPYVALAWVVWMTGNERNLGVLLGVVGVLVVARVLFLPLRVRARRHALP